MKPNCVDPTTLLVTLNLIITITIAQSNYTNKSHDAAITFSNSTTVSPTAIIFEEDPVTNSSNFSEISTTSTPPDTMTGFNAILYAFAVVGLTFSIILLVRTIRSSSFCDRDIDESYNMGEINDSRSWRPSWRGKSNKRSFTYPDHIISV